MITSAQISLLSELRQTPIPQATLVEMEARLQLRIHSMILDAFNKSGLSQKEVADRLGWDNARISRLLGSPSNLTIGTISALLAAIGVDFNDPSYTSFNELERRLRMPTRVPKRERSVKRVSKMLTAPQMELFLADLAAYSFGELSMPSPSSDHPSGAVRGLEVVPLSPYDGKVTQMAEYKARKLGENRNPSIGAKYA